jgi:hypothetical protein
MLYNIVTEQVSQRTVFHKLLMDSSIHMPSVILYVRRSFSLIWHGNGFVKVSNLRWCPDGSGTKATSYEPVSQIALFSVSIILVLNVHIPACLVPGLKGEALFSELLVFLLCLLIVDRLV